MNLVNFENEYGMRLGIIEDQAVLDVTEASHALGIKAPRSLEALLDDATAGLPLLSTIKAEAGDSMSYWRDVTEVRLGPAVPRPGKIVCVGLNYKRHAEEAGMPIPEEPVLFGAFSNTVSGPGSEIDVTGLEQLDYESELCIVIGKHTRRVSAQEAPSHILGYCNSNDLSERALQLKSGQWLLGKSLDGFVPLGPWLRVADESFDPDNLQIRGWLNGELRQDSNTADMIFTTAELVSYVSRYISLEPGDVILTGTPEGVIMGMDEPRWMKPGDEFTVEIEGLGQLTNRLTSAR